MARYGRGNFSSNSGDFSRKKLDVNLFLVLALGLGLALAIYGTVGVVSPLRTSPIGILLYERGLTQHLAIAFASTVCALITIKFFKLQKEVLALKKSWIPETVNFASSESKDLLALQRILAKEKMLLPIRCSRILTAYAESGSRKVATELALDDSSFSQSASESSYTFPRILVWSIPLLGFIGTVVGISQSIGGFQGVLEKAGDVEQIKEGISNVTNGLAVAFDTTLLALLLSILVMIPLVLVERFESRLLLGIDVYISDRLLSRLIEVEENLREADIDRAIDRAVKNHFPAPEALIEPAKEYARQAASNFFKSFVSEVDALQQVGQKFVGQIEQINHLILQDREGFVNSLESQQDFNQNLVEKIDKIVGELGSSSANISQGLNSQTEKIRRQLEGLANLLEARVISLEKATVKISDLTELQGSLEGIFLSLEKVERLDPLLAELGETLAQLKPALEQLSRPRIITFVDSEGKG